MSKRASIAVNLVDLWAEPQYNSERVSQGLYAESVNILRQESGFSKVQLSDSYRGWIDSRFLTAQPGDGESPNYQVTAKQAIVTNSRGDTVRPYLLFYGSKIRGRKTANGKVRVSAADKSTFYLSSRHVTPILSNMNIGVTPAMLAREARKFLGITFLWGGKSPLGFDCSGFIQAIFDRFGIALPRDTKDQINCGERITREAVEIGDLLFFDRHVALALNGKEYIHCSVGHPGVAINSFDTGAGHYRADLDRDFNQARRII